MVEAFAYWVILFGLLFAISIYLILFGLLFLVHIFNKFNRKDIAKKVYLFRLKIENFFRNISG
jgi:hypothetical protein